MPKLVFQMMTTLTGRLDSPYEWIDSVSDDHYQAIEATYAKFGTVLVGRTTYDEMVAYWPSAHASGEGSATNRLMAKHMHDCRKIAFSRHGTRPLLPWNNAEQVSAPDDAALDAIIAELKSGDGKDLHLSGGSSFARRVIALGLVDEFHFFVYPVVSPGPSWFAEITGRLDLELIGARSFEDGVVGLSYRARAARIGSKPERFTELLS